MTSRLARHAGKVIAIELDHRLAPGLRKVTAPLGNVEVVESDVLAVDFGAIVKAANFSVYGNLPYYITSPILHRLFEHADRIEAIHIVIQLEVAVRIVAPPDAAITATSRWCRNGSAGPSSCCASLRARFGRPPKSIRRW